MVAMQPNDSDSQALAKQMPVLFEQMRRDLLEIPTCRTFLLLSLGGNYESVDIDFAYFFEEHELLKVKISALESDGYVRKIASHPVDRFEMSERFVALLQLQSTPHPREQEPD
jgi:hypothetical protein